MAHGRRRVRSTNWEHRTRIASGRTTVPWRDSIPAREAAKPETTAEVKGAKASGSSAGPGSAFSFVAWETRSKYSYNSICKHSSCQRSIENCDPPRIMPYFINIWRNRLPGYRRADPEADFSSTLIRGACENGFPVYGRELHTSGWKPLPAPTSPANHQLGPRLPASPPHRSNRLRISINIPITPRVIRKNTTPPL